MEGEARCHRLRGPAEEEEGQSRQQPLEGEEGEECQFWHPGEVEGAVELEHPWVHREVEVEG